MSEVDSLRDALRQFAEDREWDQFHSPKNLASALSVEAAELLEPFQWLTDEQSRNLSPEKREAVRKEIADVLIYLIRLSDKLDIDLLQAARDKIVENASKYPVEKAIRDNFLRAWLSALQRPVSAIAFRPLDTLITQADERLTEVEGHALEDLAGQLYEERSRRGIGDFALTERIRGYWDRGDVDIDLVAVGEEQRRLRFGTCKRASEKLPGSVEALKQNAQRFLASHKRFESWRLDFVAIAPEIPAETRRALEGVGVIPQSLSDLTAQF